MTLYSGGGGGGGGCLSPAALESAVAILGHLEIEQLEKMNDDETELLNIINDSEMVKKLQTEREDLVASNRSLAEFNLSVEPSLKEKKELLRELYVTQSEVFAGFDDKKRTLEKNTGATSLDTVLAILQSETATSEEASEEMAEQFLSDSKPVEEFLPAFREKRKVAHMQRIKSEKIQEMIANGVVANGPSQPQPQPLQHPIQAQEQNNLNSSWNPPPQAAFQAPSPAQRTSPTRRPAPPPPPSMPSYGGHSPYPAYTPGHGTPPTHGAYGTPPPQPPASGIQTGPPPQGSVPYPVVGQPPAQTYPSMGGPPRGGWGQGRAPYQPPYPAPNPGYMAMPQPHLPNYR